MQNKRGRPGGTQGGQQNYPIDHEAIHNQGESFCASSIAQNSPVDKESFLWQEKDTLP